MSESEHFDINSMKSQFFRKSLGLSWSLIYVYCFLNVIFDLPKILPELISCTSRTITISVSMRELRQFAKDFSFKVAWN